MKYRSVVVMAADRASILATPGDFSPKMLLDSYVGGGGVFWERGAFFSVEVTSAVGETISEGDSVSFLRPKRPILND